MPCGNARICEDFFKKSSNTLFHSLSLATHDIVVNANLVRKIWCTRVYANQRFDFNADCHVVKFLALKIKLKLKTTL